MITRQLAKRRKNAQHRHGTTIVETAIVLPVFLMLLFAIIEFGHAQLVKNMLNNACRTAARVGSVEGTTSAEVTNFIHQKMSPVIASQNVNVFVNDAGVFDSQGSTPADGSEIEALPSMELSDTEPRQLFVVRATLNYNDIALVPMPFLKNLTLDSQAFMRHE